MNPSDAQWQPALDKLVSTLVSDGDLHSPEWVSTFRQVPRHVFVPHYFVHRDGTSRKVDGTDPTQHSEWLRGTYSGDALITQRTAHPAGYLTVEGEPLQVPTSSSTAPGLMARMLEALDIQDGHRILEIGTGTGYNTALLSHRLGAANVVSIDIDPELVSLAGERLARLGLAPTLLAGDGTAGAPGLGPFDRIIVTAGVPGIPLPWIEQLVTGGRLLLNLRGELATGSGCLLTRAGPHVHATGTFVPINGSFMWLRPELNDPERPHQAIPASSPRPVSTGSTRLDPTGLFDHETFRFLLQLQLFGVESLYRAEVPDPRTRRPRAVAVLAASDGSRADVEVEAGADGSRAVVQRGPRRLWDTVEATARLVRERGGPAGLERFGVTVDDAGQYVWLDADDGAHRWPLPLV